MQPAIVVLLAEDEIIIQDMLKEAFADAGFEPIVASDGKQALAELEVGVSRFRAVVTDIKLGTGPTGWDVAKRARELDHNMPVVYMSGDGAPDWPSLGVPKSIMVVKPFAPTQIITAVSTLITEADLHRDG